MTTHYNISSNPGEKNEHGNPKNFRYIEHIFESSPYPTEGQRVCSCCGSQVFFWKDVAQFKGQRTDNVQFFKSFVCNNNHLGVAIFIGAPTKEIDCVTDDYIVETQEIDGEFVTFKYVTK